MEPTRKRSQMEVAFQHLEAHMLFVCPECGETYPTQQQWRQHLNFHHDYLCKKAEDFGFVEVNDRFHECQICNAMVADGKRAIALLQYHRFLHLPHSRTYRCLHCLASFTRKRVLCEHLCRSHEKIVGQNVADFAKMKLASTTTSEQSSHIMKAKQSTSQKFCKNAKDNSEFYLTYNCPQCGVQIEDYKKWMIHIKTMHVDIVRSDCEMQRVSGTINYYCKICRKVIYSNDSAKLQRHYFSHMPHRVSFQCAYCKVQRSYKTELLHHFIRTHIREFNLQRDYIRKPVEWGAEVNEALDKEVDLLLKYGSGLGSFGGSISVKLTPTTVTNCIQNNQLIRSNSTNDLEKATTTQSNDGYYSETTSTTSNTILSKVQENETKEKMVAGQNKRNDLEALCAEIFGDIDTETEQITTSSHNELKPNQIEIPEETNHSNTHEEIVSIEINPFYANEVKQIKEEEEQQAPAIKEVPNIPPNKRLKLNDSLETATTPTTTTTTTTTSPSITEKTKIYPTLKSIFNAKVLHLCPKCGKSFGEQSIWREHVLNAHDNLDKMLEECYKPLDDQDSNLCLNCMQVLPTTNKSELQRHSFTHMPYHAYLKCTLCGTSKSNKTKMLRHLEMEHISLLEKTKESSEKLNEKPIEQMLNDIEIKQENEAETTVEKFLRKDCKKIEFSHIVKHLINACDRLNRIEAGIETF